MLLQKVNHESDKPGSGFGLKFAFWLLSLAAAFLAGRYYDHPKSHPAPDSSITIEATPSPTPEAESSTPEPVPAIAAATPIPAKPSAKPPLISDTEDSTPPPAVRIEKATPVVASATPALISATPTPMPAAVPIKKADEVTITEPVEIPVKTEGKITGYINLQKGQVVTPVKIEGDQIKVKSGAGFVMVPIKSTDMAH